MVNSWSPDPQQSHCGDPGPISSLSANVVDAESSDSENDDLPNDGYELLPMTPVEEFHLNSDDDDDDDNDAEQDDENQPAEENSFRNQQLEEDEEQGTSSAASFCSSEQNVTEREEMDPELMEKVKTAMSGFTLPLTAVPNWAFLVPEEEWRSHLVERMQCIQSGNSSVRTNHSSSVSNVVNSQNNN